jgi:hypothetical protein
VTVAYDIGQTYQTAIDVTDAGNLPATPDQAVLTVTWWDAAGQQASVYALHPTGSQQQLPDPDPAGHVALNWQFTEAATYCFDWQADGPGGVSAHSSDYVTARKYIAALPLADAADWVGLSDAQQMPKLRAALALATKIAEDVVGPTVPRTYTDDWIPGTTRPVLRVPRPPLPTSSSVTALRSVYDGGPAWDPADLIVNPAAGTIRWKAGMDFWYGPWFVTYTAGRAEVSENIAGGVREILWDLWATQRYIFGDALEPDAADTAAFESRLPPGWAPPRRAMELFGSDTQPSFG